MLNWSVVSHEYATNQVSFRLSVLGFPGRTGVRVRIRSDLARSSASFLPLNSFSQQPLLLLL